MVYITKIATSILVLMVGSGLLYSITSAGSLSATERLFTENCSPLANTQESTNNPISLMNGKINLTVDATPLDPRLANDTWWIPPELPNDFIGLFEFNSTIDFVFNISVGNVNIASGVEESGNLTVQIPTNLWLSENFLVNFTITVENSSGSLDEYTAYITTADTDDPEIISKPPANSTLEPGFHYNFSWVITDSSGKGTYTIIVTNDFAQSGVWENYETITLTLYYGIEKNIVIAILIYDMYENKVVDSIDIVISPFDQYPVFQKSDNTDSNYVSILFIMTILFLPSFIMSNKRRSQGSLKIN